MVVIWGSYGGHMGVIWGSYEAYGGLMGIILEAYGGYLKNVPQTYGLGRDPETRDPKPETPPAFWKISIKKRFFFG